MVSSIHQLCIETRWSYVQKNNVQLPDEYDQIVNPKPAYG